MVDLLNLVAFQVINMNDDLGRAEDPLDIFANEPMDLEQIKLTLAVMQLDAADRAVIRVAGSLLAQY